MTWVAVAVGGASIVGGLISGNASENAAQTQANASNAATQAQLQMWQQTRADMAPWMQAGNQGLNALLYGMGIMPQMPQSAAAPGAAPPAAAPGAPAGAPTPGAAPSPSDPGYGRYIDPVDFGGGGTALSIYSPAAAGATAAPAGAAPAGAAPGGPYAPPAGLGFGDLTRQFTMADFAQSPGYSFQMSQGIDAINNSAAAGGVTGNTLKQLDTFGQGLANQDYWNAYNAFTNRQQTLLGDFSGISSTGANAAAGLGGIGTQVGSGIGSNLIGAGNARAAGQVGMAGAVAGGVNGGLTNWLLASQMQQPGGYQQTPYTPVGLNYQGDGW